MSVAKKIFTNYKVILLIIIVLISLWAIQPRFNNEGVVIRSVIKESAANLAGIPIPNPKTPPISREKIISINNNLITNEKEYYQHIAKLVPNQTITIKTNKAVYQLNVKPLIENETLIGAEDIGLRVFNAPTNNIRKGLDLQGGTRVLLEPETPLSAEDTASLIDNMKERLNIYGLSDLTIKPVTDRPGIIGEGKTYILVEIAGASQEEVRDLLAKQGKFEAKIGNATVFLGGDDIKAVCRTADCSGIDPRQGCVPIQEGYSCRFRFSITLSTQAAQKQADISSGLETLYEGNEEYLNETLDLYLDDSLVDSLKISSELKGRAVTDIQISGGGQGRMQQEAVQDSLKNMKKLQTVLITGSLPVKLSIIKIDTISASLGEGFVSNIILIVLASIVAVALVIFIRYRKLEVSLPIVIIMISEIVILLGIASILKWNLDMAAIAGILVATGTGVDDQIIIADETLKGENAAYSSWKDKLKKAFFIIFAAYFVTVASMIPLYFAGAGLLKGFAIMTIAGVTIGVLITRPAYAAISEILINK